MIDGFFKCGFCKAEAPEGKHVCGDRYSKETTRRLYLASHEHAPDGPKSCPICREKFAADVFNGPLLTIENSKPGILVAHQTVNDVTPLVPYGDSCGRSECWCAKVMKQETSADFDTSASPVR